MRRFGGMKPGIGLLVGLLSVATFMAAPASARVHHHHHHHHHGGGSGPTCGPGTVNIGGTCTPSGSSGPTGNSNVVITPSSVQMFLDGSFNAAVTVSGFPPFAFLNLPASVQCGPGGFGFVTEFGSGQTDATGRLQGVIGSFPGAPPSGCVPGTYPIMFSDPNTPFQTFTGFVTLHF